jgi:hypothetical protein
MPGLGFGLTHGKLPGALLWKGADLLNFAEEDPRYQSSTKMDTSTPRLERLRAFLRPVIEWSYLVTGMVILALIAAWTLEQVGLLEAPVEGSIPDAAYLVLAFASMAVGGLIFLGWPFALAVIWLYRRERRILLPAAFFLAAELAFAVNTLVVPGSEAMFILSGGLLGLHAVTGVRAWARRRQGTRLHGWAIFLVALPSAHACTPLPEVWLAERYESPQVHRPSELIVLQGVVPRQNWEIFTVRPDGTGLRNLTNHPGEDAWPVLSPDSR